MATSALSFKLSQGIISPCVFAPLTNTDQASMCVCVWVWLIGTIGSFTDPRFSNEYQQRAKHVILKR